MVEAITIEVVAEAVDEAVEEEAVEVVEPLEIIDGTILAPKSQDPTKPLKDITIAKISSQKRKESSSGKQ